MKRILYVLVTTVLDKGREMNDRLNSAYKSDDVLGEAREAITALGGGLLTVVRTVGIIAVNIALILAGLKYATSSPRGEADGKDRIIRIVKAVLGIGLIDTLLILTAYLAEKMIGG